MPKNFFFTASSKLRHQARFHYSWTCKMRGQIQTTICCKKVFEVFQAIWKKRVLLHHIRLQSRVCGESWCDDDRCSCTSSPRIYGKGCIFIATLDLVRSENEWVILKVLDPWQTITSEWWQQVHLLQWKETRQTLEHPHCHPSGRDTRGDKPQNITQYKRSHFAYCVLDSSIILLKYVRKTRLLLLFKQEENGLQS